jgi:hypothetical protein
MKVVQSLPAIAILHRPRNWTPYRPCNWSRYAARDRAFEQVCTAGTASEIPIPHQRVPCSSPDAVPTSLYTSPVAAAC